MKVTEETFSFSRKSAKGERYQRYRNFQAKGPLPDRTLGSLIKKAPTRQFLIFRKTLTEYTKKSFPDFLGRIFQVKRQSKKVILLFSYSVFFFKKNFILFCFKNLNTKKLRNKLKEAILLKKRYYVFLIFLSFQFLNL